MTRPPIIRRATDLAPRDGQVVVVEGLYVKRLSQRKMNEPALHFFGFAEVRLEGGAVRLSSSPRPADEVAAYEGQRVRVRGTLYLDSDATAAGAPDHARPEPVPTLEDVAGLEPVV